MQDPTDELIISVEIRVRIVDTGMHETKEFLLSEFVENNMSSDWGVVYGNLSSRLSLEMKSLIDSAQIERAKQA